MKSLLMWNKSGSGEFGAMFNIKQNKTKTKKGGVRVVMLHKGIVMRGGNYCIIFV